MPRKGNVAKRDVLPDPIYNSKLISFCDMSLSRHARFPPSISVIN